MTGHDKTKVKQHAIKCAQYFQSMGIKMVKEKTKKVDFQRMSIQEINEWILVVTDSFGIKQFKRQK